MGDSLVSRSMAQKKQFPRNATVRVGPLSGLPALVRDLGCDPDAIFNAAGFNTIQFKDPDTEILYLQGGKLLADCVAATGCDHLGLLLGQRASPSTLGLAGFLLQASPDVGDALRDLVRYLHLHDQGGVANLLTEGHSTSLSFSIHLAGVASTAQIYDLSMTIVCKTMRSLCGDNWNPTEVLLSRPLPRDPKPYHEFFRAPVRFEADQSALVFPSRWLAHPIPRADPLLHHHLEKTAEALSGNQQQSLINQLRCMLRKSLANHRSSVKDIAAQLGMHERTLNRRLQKEGTTFRSELEDVRYEVARQLLADTTLTLSRIATTVDYADPAVFCRAFKQWSGISPTDWRRQHNQQFR